MDPAYFLFQAGFYLFDGIQEFIFIVVFKAVFFNDLD